MQKEMMSVLTVVSKGQSGLPITWVSSFVRDVQPAIGLWGLISARLNILSWTNGRMLKSPG